ncbi:MAG: HlyD family secretion protein, partial [Deltaproteobacteria bacterium]|nr:HlyD family secretion protein [Deltaproteobacteria bacterium]
MSNETTKPKSKALPIVGAVVGAFALVAGVFLFVTRGEESTDDAQIEADVVPIAPRVGGQVLRVVVKDDAQVKKGDLLIELDPADLQAKLKQAEGELSTARAQADQAEAQARVAEANAHGGFSTARARVGGSTAAVANAGAQVEQAKAQLDRANTEARRTAQDLVRLKSLATANAVTQERLDNAQAASDAAEAALRGAKAQLAASLEQEKAAESRVDEARGQLRQSEPVQAMVAAARANAELAKAKVVTAEASLDQARLNLSYTRIVAPSDGAVTRLTARVGQLLSPGQAVAELVPPEVYVVAN